MRQNAVRRALPWLPRPPKYFTPMRVSAYLVRMGMNQVYSFIYEYCVKHSMTRVIEELHKNDNCSNFLSKVAEPTLLVASIQSLILCHNLDYDKIKLLLDSVELLKSQFGARICEEFSPKKFLNLIHYIKVWLITNVVLDEEMEVDEKVEELNEYFPADDITPLDADLSDTDVERFNHKRTQFRCYCLFFLASNKEKREFFSPGHLQRMRTKVIHPAHLVMGAVRQRLTQTFLEKVFHQSVDGRRNMSYPNPIVREIILEMFGSSLSYAEDDFLFVIKQMAKYILFDPAELLSTQESLDAAYNNISDDDDDDEEEVCRSPKRQPNGASTASPLSPNIYNGKVYKIKRVKKTTNSDGHCLLSRTSPPGVSSPRNRLSPPIVQGWWKDKDYLANVRYRRFTRFPKVVLNLTNVRPGQRVKVNKHSGSPIKAKVVFSAKGLGNEMTKIRSKPDVPKVMPIGTECCNHTHDMRNKRVVSMDLKLPRINGSISNVKVIDPNSKSHISMHPSEIGETLSRNRRKQNTDFDDTSDKVSSADKNELPKLSSSETSGRPEKKRRVSLESAHTFTSTSSAKLVSRERRSFESLSTKHDLNCSKSVCRYGCMSHEAKDPDWSVTIPLKLEHKLERTPRSCAKMVSTHKDPGLDSDLEIDDNVLNLKTKSVVCPIHRNMGDLTDIIEDVTKSRSKPESRYISTNTNRQQGRRVKRLDRVVGKIRISTLMARLRDTSQWQQSSQGYAAGKISSRYSFLRRQKMYSLRNPELSTRQSNRLHKLEKSQDCVEKSERQSNRLHKLEKSQDCVEKSVRPSDPTTQNPKRQGTSLECSIHPRKKSSRNRRKGEILRRTVMSRLRDTSQWQLSSQGYAAGKISSRYSFLRRRKMYSLRNLKLTGCCSKRLREVGNPQDGNKKPDCPPAAKKLNRSLTHFLDLPRDIDGRWRSPCEQDARKETSWRKLNPAKDPPSGQNDICSETGLDSSGDSDENSGISADGTSSSSPTRTSSIVCNNSSDYSGKEVRSQGHVLLCQKRKTSASPKPLTSRYETRPRSLVSNFEPSIDSSDMDLNVSGSSESNEANPKYGSKDGGLAIDGTGRHVIDCKWVPNRDLTPDPSECGVEISSEETVSHNTTPRRKLKFRRRSARERCVTRNNATPKRTMSLRSSESPRQLHRYVEIGDWMVDSRFRKYRTHSQPHANRNLRNQSTTSNKSSSTLQGPPIPNIGRFLKSPYVKPCLLKLKRLDMSSSNGRQKVSPKSSK